MKRFAAKLMLIGWMLLNSLWPANGQEALSGGVQLESEKVSAGYILFTPNSSPTTYLIDNAGRVIQQWESEHRSLMAYLLENSHIIMSVITPSQRFAAGASGRIEEYDWEGNLVWSFEYLSDTYALHHDFEPLPNGNILLSAWELVRADEALALGLRSELLAEPPENTGENRIVDDSLWLDMLLEVNPATNEIVWEWHVKDHLLQDSDPALPNYGSPSEHPERIDINYSKGRLPNDRTHFNSIDYNAELDQILVSAHYYSEIWVINHDTSSEEAVGEAGDLLYRWGNPQSYGRGTPEDRQLFNQHDARWLESGNINIFNNGHRRLRPYSTIVEIVPPLLENGSYALESNQSYGPPRPMWFYEGVPLEVFFAQNTSGAQRLSNGNLLVTEGPAGHIFEMTAQNEIVWDYLSPIFITRHPDSRGPVFRAARYSPDYSAFTGRDLTPGALVPLLIMDEEKPAQDD